MPIFPHPAALNAGAERLAPETVLAGLVHSKAVWGLSCAGTIRRDCCSECTTNLMSELMDHAAQVLARPITSSAWAPRHGRLPPILDSLSGQTKSPTSCYEPV
jgi:hypothetical protein